jgi:hypothetical protein
MSPRIIILGVRFRLLLGLLLSALDRAGRSCCVGRSQVELSRALERE